MCGCLTCALEPAAQARGPTGSGTAAVPPFGDVAPPAEPRRSGLQDGAFGEQSPSNAYCEHDSVLGLLMGEQGEGRRASRRRLPLSPHRPASAGDVSPWNPAASAGPAPSPGPREGVLVPAFHFHLLFYFSVFYCLCPFAPCTQPPLFSFKWPFTSESLAVAGEGGVGVLSADFSDFSGNLHRYWG